MLDEVRESMVGGSLRDNTGWRYKVITRRGSFIVGMIEAAERRSEALWCTMADDWRKMKLVYVRELIDEIRRRAPHVVFKESNTVLRRRFW